jgi:hypothetical protein
MRRGGESPRRAALLGRPSLGPVCRRGRGHLERPQGKGVVARVPLSRVQAAEVKAHRPGEAAAAHCRTGQGRRGPRAGAGACCGRSGRRSRRGSRRKSGPRRPARKNTRKDGRVLGTDLRRHRQEAGGARAGRDVAPAPACESPLVSPGRGCRIATTTSCSANASLGEPCPVQLREEHSLKRVHKEHGARPGPCRARHSLLHVGRIPRGREGGHRRTPRRRRRRCSGGSSSSGARGGRRRDVLVLGRGRQAGRDETAGADAAAAAAEEQRRGRLGTGKGGGGRKGVRGTCDHRAPLRRQQSPRRPPAERGTGQRTSDRGDGDRVGPPRRARGSCRQPRASPRQRRMAPQEAHAVEDDEDGGGATRPRSRRVSARVTERRAPPAADEPAREALRPPTPQTPSPRPLAFHTRAEPVAPDQGAAEPAAHGDSRVRRRGEDGREREKGAAERRQTPAPQ